jgi:hypothetical protein
MSKFIRPAHLKYPQVYHTFRAKDKDSDELVEYRVQDLPEEFIDEAVELLKMYFIPDEPLCIAADVPNSPDTIKIYCEFWRKILIDRWSLACFKGASNELVGLNVLGITARSEPFDIKVHSTK